MSDLVIVVPILSLMFASSHATLVQVSHFSHVLQKDQPVYICLPADYEQNADRHYPVLYLLHGVEGSYANWVQASNLVNYAQAYDMIIVMPDGGQYGWYVDSPFDSSIRYESYIILELIPFVQDRYRTRNARNSRGICGLSMGGHGAVSLTCKYPELFGSTSSLSGILDLTIHPLWWPHWKLEQIFGTYEENPEIWRANNSYDLAERLIGKDVCLLFECGTGDLVALMDSRRFAEKLDSLQIPYTFREYPGAHNWSYWDAHIEEHLQFHQQTFTSSSGVRFAAKKEKPVPACASYPNPFNDCTWIQFDVKVPAPVVVEICNPLGRRIKKLFDAFAQAGTRTLSWDGTDDRGATVSSGPYFCRIKTTDRINLFKLVYVR